MGKQTHKWLLNDVMGTDMIKIFFKKGGSGGWDELGDWDWHIYTTMYKTDN